ncbi:YbhB/YbcL family Raf kinase inhibitor-like protein [Levilactobacillus acidifarinae]|nr:YbhB/YbcL family Raf kinase inhibitor-like protein [Levilactobacillus acidifarinae]GEO69290.1 phosphatidylethanolamine-binding protein [Levilactobacillus acidifarinae]
MKIITNFTGTNIPDQYGCNAPRGQQPHGINQNSFPFEVAEIPAKASYLSWTLIDYDTVPMIGFAWIHWLVADYPVVEGPAVIPAGVSQKTTVPQGKTSMRSVVTLIRHPLWRMTALGRDLTTHYSGPRPRGGRHQLRLTVYATSAPLDLAPGFGLNQLMATVDEKLVAQASLNLAYERKSH